MHDGIIYSSFINYIFEISEKPLGRVAVSLQAIESNAFSWKYDFL